MERRFKVRKERSEGRGIFCVGEFAFLRSGDLLGSGVCNIDEIEWSGEMSGEIDKKMGSGDEGDCRWR